MRLKFRENFDGWFDLKGGDFRILLWTEVCNSKNAVDVLNEPWSFGQSQRLDSFKSIGCTKAQIQITTLENSFKKDTQKQSYEKQKFELKSEYFSLDFDSIWIDFNFHISSFLKYSIKIHFKLILFRTFFFV